MDIKKKDNDFVLVNGDFQIVEETEETAQRVKERLQSYAYEFFINDEGLPYFEEMVGKGVDANRVESYITSVVNRTYGVRQIESLEFTYDTESRDTFITSEIQTSFGSLVQVEAVLPTIAPPSTGVPGTPGTGTGGTPTVPVTPPPTMDDTILKDFANENLVDFENDNLLDLS